MAITFIDGFDLYGTFAAVQAVWTRSDSPALSLTGGRFGGGAVVCAGSSSESISQVYSGAEYITVGFALNSTMSSDNRIFSVNITSLMSSSNQHMGVTLNSNGSLTIEGANGTAHSTSAPGLIAANQWVYIEVKMRRHDTLGSVEVFVGGASAVSDTSIDTNDSATPAAFVGFLSEQSSVSCTFDDVYIAESAAGLISELGDVKITTLLPNGDTAQADWTPLSGAGWSNIDDDLGTDGDDNASYIAETTLNGKSEFDLEDLPETPIGVHAVAISTRATKTDAGSIEYKHHIDSNGTESAGAAISPSETGYALATTVYPTDPDTAAAWTESGVNAMKLGVEVTA